MGEPAAAAVTLDDPSDHSAHDAWLAEALATFARTHDPALRDEIVQRSLWLARRSARRFGDRGEPFDDLLQVASIALMSAVERFDPSLGVPFGAFATPTIIGEIKRHFRDRTWRVHVPRTTKDMRPTVNAAYDDLSQMLDRSPTAREVALHLDIDEDLVLQVVEANSAYRTAPLEALSERRVLGQTAAALEAELDGVLDRDVVRQVLGELQPRERQIIEMRYFEGMTQAQIAERIGTSQVHVGRLITSSLTMLRAYHAEGSLVTPGAEANELRHGLLARDRATRWSPVRPSPSVENLVRIYQSEPVSARAAREFVAAELLRADASTSAIDDLGLIVSELVANSIQHGDGGVIAVRVDPDSGASFAVTVGSGVAAKRPPMDPATWTVSPPHQPSGRGLGIVRQLADEITVALESGRLDITCRRRH
jgi:RNA polymerase sigma-B factor